MLQLKGRGFESRLPLHALRFHNAEMLENNIADYGAITILV